MSLVVRARGLIRGFSTPAGRIGVLRDLDLDVRKGEMVAIIGRSGVGKTTLLQLLGALELPEGGDLRLLGQPAGSLSEPEAARFRNRHIGFVFQHHRLLPEFTAAENVAMPLRIQRIPRAGAERRAADLLGELGLGGRLHHRPEELSGGEQQRTAVARALVAEPGLLLADEPTGNLDDEVSRVLVDLLAEQHRTRGLTSVIATHNPAVAARCDRVLRLDAGQLRPVDGGGPLPLVSGDSRVDGDSRAAASATGC